MTPALRSFEAQWRGRAADPLSQVRRQAMEHFMRLGIPTLRDESWRYTDLRSLAAQSFVDAPQDAMLGGATHAAPLLNSAEGALTVDATVTAQNVSITTDAGALTVTGTIDASSA